MTASLSGTWSIIIITVTFSASFADDNLNWMSVFTAQTGGWDGLGKNIKYFYFN